MANLIMLETELYPYPGYPHHTEETVFQISDRIFLAVDRSDGCSEKSKVEFEEDVLSALRLIDKQELIEASESPFQYDLAIKPGKMASLSVHNDIFGRIIAILHYPEKER